VHLHVQAIRLEIKQSNKLCLAASNNSEHPNNHQQHFKWTLANLLVWKSQQRIKDTHRLVA